MLALALEGLALAGLLLALAFATGEGLALAGLFFVLDAFTVLGALAGLAFFAAFFVWAAPRFVPFAAVAFGSSTSVI